MEYYHALSSARLCSSLNLGQRQDYMKDERYWISLQIYLCLLDPLLENIWVWAFMGSGIWTWIFSWYCAGSTCWISTWIFHDHDAWLGILIIIWHRWMIFVWSFTWHTGWIDDWHWRRIRGWLINVTYNWVSTCLSKSLSDWCYTWHSY